MTTGADPRDYQPESDRARAEMLTLAQASRVLDVPEAAIQSWVRRYQLTGLAPASADPDLPRYSPDAIRVLRRLRDYIATGHGTAEAAEMIDTAPGARPEQLVHALVTAAQHLQPADISSVLDAAHRQLGLDRTIDDVLMPALRAIGERWAEGTSTVAEEHAASEAVHSWLAAAARRTRAPGRSQPIVLACGPRDHHTLGLESLGVLLLSRGWDCLLLGARTPADALARTVADVAPSAVVVVSHLASTRRSAVEAVRLAQRDHTPLFIAGNAFRTARTRLSVPATYLGENLAHAADLICASVGSGRMAL